MLQVRDSSAPIPGARFLDPKVLARIDNLELIARMVVSGFISGLHRSPHLALSIDFAEHRAYMPGDDIRRIDWRVFARTDRLYVKETEADTNANFSVLLDVSRSMDYGGGGNGLSKLDYGRFLAASLSYLSSRQRDRVGLITFDTELIDIIPPSAKHFETILHTLDRLQAGRRSEFGQPLRRVANSLHRRGILALISDLYEEPSRIVNALAELRFRGHDLIVFHILDPSEVEFDFSEAAPFEDLETGERLPVIPSQFRTEYRARIQRHIDTLQKRLGGSGIDYAFFTTDQPLDHALFRYLSDRQRLARVR